MRLHAFLRTWARCDQPANPARKPCRRRSTWGTNQALRASELHGEQMTTPDTDAIAGALLGGAYGDAAGLASEGLRPERTQGVLRRKGRPHALLPGGRSMVSDDTEHACMTAFAYADSDEDLDRFRRSLRRRLRWWLLTVPPAIGWATLRAIVRMWFGVRRPGVHSAGNGPCMRAAVRGSRSAVRVGRSKQRAHAQ